MKTQDTQFVTDLEREVISNIIHSEYMDAQGEQIINWSVWSFSATNERKDLAGALGSLTKKGLVACEGQEEDHTCCLTEQGYHWAKNNGLIKK